MYCLSVKNQQSQDQTLHDIFKEHKQADKFFENAMNFLLVCS